MDGINILSLYGKAFPPFPWPLGALPPPLASALHKLLFIGLLRQTHLFGALNFGEGLKEAYLGATTASLSFQTAFSQLRRSLFSTFGWISLLSVPCSPPIRSGSRQPGAVGASVPLSRGNASPLGMPTASRQLPAPRELPAACWQQGLKPRQESTFFKGFYFWKGHTRVSPQGNQNTAPLWSSQ